MSTTRKSNPNSLARCIWHLGFTLGWRYWRISRWAMKNPELVTLWAFRCRHEANEAEWHGKTKEAAILRDWATKLEEGYNRFTQTGPALDTPLSN